MFQSVLIYGFGLMGASLSLAIRKKQLADQITAVVRNQTSLEEIKKLNFQDSFITEDAFLSQNIWNEFDFIVFCLPVDTIVKKIFFIPESYQGIITDLGSTKKMIIEAVEKKFPNFHNYISSHPMTGSENSGAEFAKEDLYENKVCILTCPKNYKTESLEKLKKFWISLNCQIAEMPAADHDEVLTYLSHSPHILSSLLVNWALKNEKVENYTESISFPLVGGGFRDMSRIAGSNPEMWDAIIRTNSDFILKSLMQYKEELEELIHILENPSLQENFWKTYFEKSKFNRLKILKLDHEFNKHSN